MVLTGRDTCHSDTSPTTNVTWVGLGANPDLCSVRLASNRLRFGTASCMSDTQILLCDDCVAVKGEGGAAWESRRAQKAVRLLW
jgi:hypothetical protein